MKIFHHLKTWAVVALCFITLGATNKALADSPLYHMVVDSSRGFFAHETLTHEYPHIKITDFSVMAPIPPQMPGRQESIKSTLAVDGFDEKDVKQLVEKNAANRPFFFINEPQAGSLDQVSYTVTYEGRISATHLELGAPATPIVPLDPQKRKLYLGTDRELDYDSTEFQEYLDYWRLRKGPEESDCQFARRAFSHVKHKFAKDGGGPEHLLSKLVFATTTDCGGFSQFFVGICRANGIPARLLAGRWISDTTSKEGDAGACTHCETEFWLDGTGWVPVDACQACGYPDSEDDNWFGRFQGNFLVMHVGIDMQSPKGTVVVLQTPATWLFSTTGGSAEGYRVTGTWVMRPEPLKIASN